MGFFSNLFGKSNQPPKPQPAMNPTEKAFWLLGAKSEAAFLEALAQEPAIDVNNMSQGAPMLSFAISENLDNAARAILERKPDLGLADPEYGMTALHLAVTKGKVPLVKALLAAGRGMDQQNVRSAARTAVDMPVNGGKEAAVGNDSVIAGSRGKSGL